MKSSFFSLQNSKTIAEKSWLEFISIWWFHDRFRWISNSIIVIYSLLPSIINKSSMPSLIFLFSQYDVSCTSVKKIMCDIFWFLPYGKNCVTFWLWHDSHGLHWFHLFIYFYLFLWYQTKEMTGKWWTRFPFIFLYNFFFTRD